jgi:RNA polymerase sigma-70 factor (ECF subfamily)
MQAQTAATARPAIARPASARQAPGAQAATRPEAPLDLHWSDLLPHRVYLVQFARRRLLDPSLAEDLVHDVFEAVMTGAAQFGGRSALRSWLVAILKHKIVDLIRERSGHDSLDAGGHDDDDDGAVFELESQQPRPDEVAEQRQLLALTLARITALPAKLRAVVEQRVLRDAPTDEVCRTLDISEQNLFVRLHRARRMLAS